MTNSRTSRCHLHIPSHHRLDVSHAILVAQFSRDDVGKNFGLSMRVVRESLLGLWGVSNTILLVIVKYTHSDSVFVNDSEGTKVVKVVILPRGE